MLTTKCPACALLSSPGAQYCRQCGVPLVADEAGPTPRDARTGFSWAWALGGSVIMCGAGFLMGLLVGMVGGALGVELGIGGLAVAGLLAFGLGGFIIGRRSAGKTILEAGVAAALAVVGALLLTGTLTVLGVVAGGALPFLAGLTGGWLGEKAQGTL